MLRTPISVSGYSIGTVTNLTQVGSPNGVGTNILTFGEVGGSSQTNVMQSFWLRRLS